ncbi:15181_t:CDS:2, partial [Dentiscutata erythropus]
SEGIGNVESGTDGVMNVMMHELDRVAQLRLESKTVLPTFRYMKAKKYNEETQDGIIEKIKSENEDGVNINRLKRLRQHDNESVKEYTNRYEAQAESVKDALRIDEKRDWVLEIEDFRKDKDDSKEKDRSTPEVSTESSNTDIDSLAKDFAGLKICCVEQKKDDENWAHKLESNIKELTKANQAPRPRRCYECNQEGYIARNCLIRAQKQNNNHDNEERNNQILNPEIRGLNVRLFEIKETTSSKSNEYLMIKVEGSDMLFDIRNLRKRRHCNDDDENEMPTWAKSKFRNDRTHETRDDTIKPNMEEIQPIEAETLQNSSHHG